MIFGKKIGKLSLANHRKRGIPKEFVDCQGNSTYNCDEILKRWKTDYSDLSNSEIMNIAEQNTYENVLQQLQEKVS